MSSRYHIGISGWTYSPWRGHFYPEGLTVKRELSYASRAVNSIEINGTFYRLQTPRSFAHWREETPEDFVFSIKASRYITHIKRLRDSGEAMTRFFGSGVLALGPKLGPFLWQLPPSFRFDETIMDDFLKSLPMDTDQASNLAKRADLPQDKKLARPEAHAELHHAIEIRHESFRTSGFIDLLRAHNVSLVFADTVKWPYIEDVTGSIIYARLHGSEELYVSGYSDEALKKWAGRFSAWADGGEPENARKVTNHAPSRGRKDVFVYFDNDVKVHAPFNAQTLAGLLR